MDLKTASYYAVGCIATLISDKQRQDIW